MKLKIKWLLLILSLLLVFSLFNNTRCTYMGKEDPVVVIHKSSMPYYDSLITLEVDSVIREAYNGTEFVDLIYWKNGMTTASYDNLHIKNVILRDLYTNYQEQYKYLLKRFSYEFSRKDLNYLLFNVYLYDRQYEVITKTDYMQQVRGPTVFTKTEKHLSKIILWIIGILFIIMFVYVMVKFINLNKTNLILDDEELIK